MGAVPIVLVDEAYWRSLIRWEVLVAHGMVTPQDLELLRFAEDADSAWALLEQAGVALGTDHPQEPAASRPA